MDEDRTQLGPVDHWCSTVGQRRRRRRRPGPTNSSETQGILHTEVSAGLAKGSTTWLDFKKLGERTRHGSVLRGTVVRSEEPPKRHRLPNHGLVWTVRKKRNRADSCIVLSILSLLGMCLPLLLALIAVHTPKAMVATAAPNKATPPPTRTPETTTFTKSTIKATHTVSSGSNSYNNIANDDSVTVVSTIQIIETELRSNGMWTTTTTTGNSSDDNHTTTSSSHSTTSRSSPNDDETPEQLPTSRWTNAKTKEPVAAPWEYTLQSNQKWIGDWKIAIAASTMTFSLNNNKQGQFYHPLTRGMRGWHYSRREDPTTIHQTSAAAATTTTTSPLLPYTHRQRTWLRSVATTTQRTPPKTSSSSKESRNASLQLSRKRLKRSNNHHEWLQRVRDDWNFKGFGFTLLKSAVFGRSGGIAVRLPLTLNFASWERHPVLPSLGSSFAIFYHPFTVVCFLNMSLRMEYIQAILAHVALVVPAVATQLLLLFLRGLALAISALLFPFTLRPLLLAQPDQSIEANNQRSRSLWSIPAVQSRRHIEERLGMSWSWRWSWARGTEFRVMYSHYYAVQIASVLEACCISLPESTAWIPRHTAALGWSLSGPLRVEDEGILVTATTLLSLSGYYLTPKYVTPKFSSKVTTTDSAATAPKLETKKLSTTTSKRHAKQQSDLVIDDPIASKAPTTNTDAAELTGENITTTPVRKSWWLSSKLIASY